MDVLVIEDNLDHRELIKLSLKEIGPEMHVAAAVDLTEGLWKIASKQPDCVIMDLSLTDSTPDKTLRTAEQLLQFLPVIVFSDRGERDLKEFAALVPVQFISKVFDSNLPLKLQRSIELANVNHKALACRCERDKISDAAVTQVKYALQGGKTLHAT